MSGEEKAEFVEHLGRDQGRTYAYIHSLVRNLHDADDTRSERRVKLLVQEFAVTVWTRDEKRVE